MSARRLSLEIPNSWRNEPGGAERVVAMLSATAGSDWHERAEWLDRLVLELLARVDVSDDLPMCEWSARSFDVAVKIVARYADVRLARAPFKADEKAGVIVLDAWRRQRYDIA
jgi:phenylpropionate dioxygenase-like ring-hydroxylating dioxygenase large terminal subunit